MTLPAPSTLSSQGLTMATISLVITMTRMAKSSISIISIVLTEDPSLKREVRKVGAILERDRDRGRKKVLRVSVKGWRGWQSGTEPSHSEEKGSLKDYSIC